VLLFICISSCKVTYHGEKVLSIPVTSDEQLHLLRNLLEENEGYDIWTHDGNLVKGDNHVRVNSTLEQIIKKSFEYTVFIQDVQKLIDGVEQEHSVLMANKTVEAFFDNYRRYAEIVTELKRLATTNPNITRFESSVGKSLEGRDIPAIIISAAGFKNSKIKRIFFQSGQHAREWIGPATVMYVATKLLQDYGRDATITGLLEKLEIVIVPMSNPDGYEYAFTNERLWRKNRRKNTGGTFGVDLNRNWNDHWGGEGSSGTPSSDTYRGTSAFSEPESLLISQYISKMNAQKNILAAVDFHAYSQLILRPYGWTKNKSPDETALKIIGDGMSYEISRKSGYKYTSQITADLYIACGGASDWYYQQGIWGAYAYELRDTGKYGFILPPAQIVQTGEEIYTSMKYFIATVVDTHP